MHITLEQVDVLQELLNIGIGHSAGSLNHMVGRPIRITIPAIQVGKITELLTKLSLSPEPIISSVQLPFRGSFAGSAYLLFPTESAVALVSALTGETEFENSIHSLKEATLTEIGNIVLNGVIGSLSNGLQHHIIYLIPFYQEISLPKIIQATSSDSSEIILWAQTQFTIADYNISGNIMLMLGLPDMEVLLNAIDVLSHT